VAFGKRLSSSKRASMPIGFYNKEKKVFYSEKKMKKIIVHTVSHTKQINSRAIQNCANHKKD